MAKQIINISIILTENEKVKGTNDYNKCSMETYYKNEKGIWKFIGWSTPYETTATLKKVKDNLYLITENRNRYKITDSIKGLLGIN